MLVDYNISVSYDVNEYISGEKKMFYLPTKASKTCYLGKCHSISVVCQIKSHDIGIFSFKIFCLYNDLTVQICQ